MSSRLVGGNFWQQAAALQTLTSTEGDAKAQNVVAQRPAESSNLLGVDTDVAAARAFLAEYQAQPATHRSYVKEVERFLLWLTLMRKTSLSALNRADMLAYSEFLTDPQPRAQWCGPKRGRLAPRLTAQWRPFVGPLTTQAQRAALIVINVMLKYLVHARYMPANPLALMRPQAVRQRASLTQAAQVGERVLSDDQWRAVLSVLAPPGADIVGAQHERAVRLQRERARERFIVAALYFLALRIGELTTHCMGHFRQRRGRWSFYVVGKGSKPAEIPVNDALLSELTHFRQIMGWPALPPANDPTPLVPRSEGGPQGLTARRVHQILQALFARAADHLSVTAPEAAAHLRDASPHWLRHTSLTRQIQAGLSLPEVKANARHSKLDTTLLYVHTEQDARHDSMQAHGWTTET